MKKCISMICVFVLRSSQFLFAADQETLMALQDLYDQGVSTVSMQNTSPDGEMSRREAAIIMDKYTNEVTNTPKGSLSCQFYDLTVSEGIKQSIIASCQKGIFKGKDGFFRPYDKITRGQLVIIMARLLSGDPAMELTTAYNYLLGQKIVTIDDRAVAGRLINRSELYIMLARNISLPSKESASNPISQILKIKTYQKDDLFGNIINIAHGSAVLIDKNTLLTNAHVIVDNNGDPTYMYEICKSITMEGDPVCFAYASLMYYDLENDLALLSLPSNTNMNTPVILASKMPVENDQIITYGYPRDGGDTMTSAKGVVSGYEKGMIKTDAAINFGNSGGGAYDKYGRFIGIPTQVADKIGYIIPVSTIQKFLAKEGTIDENNTGTVDPLFIEQIQKTQKKIATKNIQEEQFSLTDIGLFSIRDVTLDQDTSLIQYNLSSKDKETQISIQTNKIYGQKTLTNLHKQIEGTFDQLFTHRSTGTFVSGDVTWAIYSGQGMFGANDRLFVLYNLDTQGSIGVGATINTSINEKESIKEATRIVRSIHPTIGGGNKVEQGTINIGPIEFQADSAIQVIKGVNNDISFMVAANPGCEGYMSTDTLDYDVKTFAALTEKGEEEFEGYDMIDQGVVNGGENRYRGYTQDEESRTMDYYTYVFSPQNDKKVIRINVWFTCEEISQPVFDTINNWVKTIKIDADSVF